MNHQEVEKIIEYFAKGKEAPLYNFTLMCGGYVCLQDWLGECPNEAAFEEACHIAIPNEVLIGDILGKIYKTIKLGNNQTMTKMAGYGCDADLLLRKWQSCGFTKSLNQIEEESGYEERNNSCINNACEKCDLCENLKDPSANSLFEFLGTLIQ